MQDSFDYSGWTGAELARAESTAEEFLSQNHFAIWQSFVRQSAILGRLVEVLRRSNLTFDERLDCFARIAEVSKGVEDTANGFFDLGSQPAVAFVLASAELP
ncbi:MAG: hypothetical protein M3N54_00325 [Acidobacteriota bacterium]|nr:hypothetical protein [Acidobacteriota bacterium]